MPHSPSPWTISGPRILSATGRSVCEVLYCGNGRAFEANRALIASAPALLAYIRRAAAIDAEAAELRRQAEGR